MVERRLLLLLLLLLSSSLLLLLLLFIIIIIIIYYYYFILLLLLIFLFIIIIIILFSCPRDLRGLIRLSGNNSCNAFFVWNVILVKMFTVIRTSPIIQMYIQMYILLLALLISSSKCKSQLHGLSCNIIPKIFSQVFRSIVGIGSGRGLETLPRKKHMCTTCNLMTSEML